MNDLLPRNFVDFEMIRPVRTFTAEEMKAMYPDRPIPDGYRRSKSGVATRIFETTSKPYVVYMVREGQARKLVSCHSTLDYADNRANKLNSESKDGTRYISGERVPGKGFKEHVETED